VNKIKVQLQACINNVSILSSYTQSLSCVITWTQGSDPLPTCEQLSFTSAPPFGSATLLRRERATRSRGPLCGGPWLESWV